METFPSFSVMEVILTERHCNFTPVLRFRVGSTLAVNAHVSLRRPPCLTRHYGILRGPKQKALRVWLPTTEAPSDFRETV